MPPPCCRWRGASSGAAPKAEAPLIVHDLKAYLEGAWSLARALDDRRLAKQGTLAGEATFVADGEGLRYHEQGELRFGAYADAVSRGYLYIFPTPACADVRFPDGRPFHALDLSAGGTHVRHVCGDDVYDGEIVVEGENAWRAVWQVRGPRKDLHIESRYRRQPSKARHTPDT